MKHKLTLPQLKKYDITQKVIEALADAESRAIIFSITRKGKTANELSAMLKIPLSSVYKKLTDLEKKLQLNRARFISIILVIIFSYFFNLKLF